jgi:hypothetical protein
MAHCNYFAPSRNARSHDSLCGAFGGGTFTNKFRAISIAKLKAHMNTKKFNADKIELWVTSTV